MSEAKPSNNDPRVGDMNRPALKSLLKTVLLASVLVIGAAQSGFAQENDPPAVEGDNATVAVVNGYEIKASEVRMAFDDVIGQLPNIPPKLRYPFVVEFLIERHLLAQLASKEGVGDTEDYKRRLAAYQAKALRDSFLVQKIGPSIPEEDMKKAYDEEAKRLQSTERARARHILVASEKEATEIIAKLKKGDKFEDLAKQYSLDGSKDFGGDLGYFTAPEMVAEFSKAAFALKKGEVSGPVKTDFGWHVIRLEDLKKGAAQPFDQVKGAIRQVLVRRKVQERLAELRKVAKVDVLDPDLKKFADDLAKQREALQKQQEGTAASGGADTEGAGGKGDLLAPEQ
jgi:peptidyl-prolyl cis-trans isomerase C